MILNWFKSLDKSSKAIVIIAFIAFIIIQSHRLQLRRAQNQLLKNLTEQIEKYQEKQNNNEAATKNINNQGKTSNKKALDDTKAIDKKLQNDKAVIDTTDISDDDILEFISKHQNR